MDFNMLQKDIVHIQTQYTCDKSKGILNRNLYATVAAVPSTTGPSNELRWDSLENITIKTKQNWSKSYLQCMPFMPRRADQ